MKKILLHIMIVIGIFAFGSLMGQNSPSDLWLNADTDDFATIQQNVENYFADKDKEARGSGYKQWKRWEYINRNRLTNDGKVFNYAAQNFEEYHNYANNNTERDVDITFGYWSSLGPTDYVDGWGWNGGVGRVNCITFHPTIASTFWVGTPAGGLWKTTNSGSTWTPLTDGMPRIGVSSMVVDYTNTNIMYLLTGDGDGADVYSIGVLKTTDGGETWTNTGLSYTVTQYKRMYKMLIHPTIPSTLFVVGTDGVLKSTNSGATWSSVLTSVGTVYDIEFKPGDPTIVYASTNSEFYRSANTGASFTQITSGVPTSGSRIAIGVTPHTPSRVNLFAGPNVGTGAFVGFYYSVNSGVDFNLYSNTPNILGYSSTGNDDRNQTTYDHCIAVSTLDRADIVCGGINCWGSSSYGSTWWLSSMWNNPPGNDYTHADIHALEVNPINDYLYCGSDGGIFVSTDFGQNWSDLTSGLAITQSYRIAGTESNVNLITNGSQDNGSNKWTGGSTWLHMMGADGMDCMIDHSNSNILYNTIQYGDLYKSTNGGSSFSYIAPASASWVTPLIMDPSNSSIIYGGYYDVYKSTDGGGTWANMGVSGSGAMAIGTNNTNRVYASADNSKTIYMSANGGSSWTTQTGLPTGSVTFIAVNPDWSLDVFVTFGGYTAGRKVFRSTDAGATWTNISGSLPNIPINCIAYQDTDGAPNDALYIGTDLGVYYRNDDLGDWIPFKNGLPATMVFDLEINETSGVITAGTYGRGLWRSQLYTSCATDYLLTQGNDESNPNYTGFQHYETSSTITSSRIITGGIGTDVTYQAGSYVKLTTGFHAQAGNLFEARIGSCTGAGPEPPSEPLSGIYVGAPIYGGTTNDNGNMEADGWSILGTDEINVNSELSMNVYPNPFSDNITITYESIQSGMVEIFIFNHMGVLVEKVVQENHNNGHKYIWDAAGLPNGVYFVNVKIGQELAKQKVVKLN